MQAIELETSIIDHKIEIMSNQLPANAKHVRVMVWVDEERPAQEANEPWPSNLCSMDTRGWRFDRDEANAR